jgi:hypothetical protein
MDGRLIAVEVTELNPIARADREIARLERALQEPLEALVVERNLGCVVVDLDTHPLPSKRELGASTPQLLEDIAGCLAGLESAPKGRKNVTVDTRVRFVRQLNLIQLPEMANQVTWLVSADEFGGWLDPIADEFVRHLLASKATQTDAYSEAWLLVADRTALVGRDLLSRALVAQRANIPHNWSRVWFLPATDRMSVLEIDLS